MDDSSRAPSPESRWSQRLFDPIDAASLAFFRAAFGLILAAEAVIYFSSGWIDEYFLAPAFHFTYPGFHWIKPWPAWGMYLHFGVLGLSALGLALGICYRLFAALFTVCFSYVFLLEQARYLNHFYLVIILGALFCAIPADAAGSLSARRRGFSRPVPRWALTLVRTQLGLVYVFAGIAKMNVDWLHGEPLRSWFEGRSEVSFFGPLIRQPFAPLLFSYGGLLLDFLAWPLLLHRHTRLPMFLMLVAFHLTNCALFGIGIFPWLMIAATTIFFEPDWPRTLLMRGKTAGAQAKRKLQGLRPQSQGKKRLIIGGLALYFAIQIAVPLRHFLYPGNPSWTEEGHRFSWHMKLRSKRGELVYRIKDRRSGKQWIVDPRNELTDWQARKLGGKPELILLYAHHLAERYSSPEYPTIEVRTNTRVSLNGRPPQALIDPERDLARESVSLLAYDWLVPLNPRP